MHKIAFHGVPRSGTSWIGALLDSSENVAYRHQPLFSYVFKSYLDENSSKGKIDLFFRLLRDSKDNFLLQKADKIAGSIPSFKKSQITHVIYKEARYHHILQNMLEQDSEIKVVGVVRNPKSVIHSWFHAPKEFDKENWCQEKEWLYAEKKNQGKVEEFYGYKKWKEVSLLFLELKKKYPNRVKLIVYKDFVVDPLNSVSDLFSFCELELNQQTDSFIKQSQSIDKSMDAYSVYRKDQTDSKWKNSLPASIIRQIDKDLSNTPLEYYNR